MTRKVFCQALGEELDGLGFQPYPGELGKRIYENISQQAWQKWLAHQTMLINEHRLSPINPEHRKFLEQEMEKYFFGEGSEMPEGYVPPEDEGAS
jgi:Fe-S cluster biosynthesis and repair protein YggX